MAALLSCLLAVIVLVAPALGDIYGHNPRFSNGRYQNQGNDHLWNRQNNNAGGYEIAPPMTYYAGSELSIQWASQHSCSSNNAECNIILQYMCTPANADADTVIRDGTSDSDIHNQANPSATDPTTGKYLYGMHENKEYADACNKRSRNRGLFTADRTVQNNAQSTRQNQNGGQDGYECQEERDYYPYWQPSPWRDIGVLTSNKANCKMYQAESQNVKSKNYCTGATNPTNGVQPVMEQECKASGGTWKSTPSFGLKKPTCGPAPWGRDNHLGSGLDGEFHHYNWTIFTSKDESCLGQEGGCVCVLRIRYNISTAETNNWGPNSVDSRNNGENSPIKDTPNVMVGGNNFTIDVDTAQFGRTFEDRTHSFFVQPRPRGISSTAKIYNLNVRGKRGNIVDTFPAVEYDFVPSHLTVKVGDYIHFQWTGSEQNDDTAGQGTPNNDRSNIVQIESSYHNYPIADGKFGKTKPLFDSESTRSYMANIGQTDCPNYDQLMAYAKANGVNDDDIDEIPNNCFVLNAAKTGYFNGGVLKMNSTGDFYYMSSRANQFSNRTQKGLITVNPLLAGWQIALIVIGGVAVIGAAAAAGCVVYAKKNPHSSLAQMVSKVPGLNRI